MRREALLRFAGCAMLGLVGSISVPNASAYGGVCMSDAELREVLIGTYTRFLGMLLGTCARRFPNHADKSMDVARKFQKVYATQIRANDRATIAVFERVQPGNGEAARDRNSILALQKAQTELEFWSEDQCRKGIKGVEGAVVVADWKLAAVAPTTLVFKQERERVPVCH